MSDADIGMGKTLSELVDIMLSGGAYVNVHTDVLPGGEIRGQISGNMHGGSN